MVRLSIYFSLLFIFLWGYGNQTFGQDKFNISGGFGFLDGLNIGARYQVKQDTLQLGISIGTYDVEKTFSGDVYYHFGGYSKLSARRPWYLKGGVTNVFNFDKENSSYWGLLLNLRLGRDINISKKVGLNLEAGLCYPPFALMMDRYRVAPGFGIYFFYRI